MLFFTHVICVLALAINARAQIFANLFVVNWPVVAYRLASVPNVVTTWLVACTAQNIQTAGYQQCDFVQPYTLIQGPSTAAYNYTGLGGIGSATVSQACDLTGTTSVECSVTGGVRLTSGVSTDIVLVQSGGFGTVTWNGSQAVALFRSVFVVQDTALLLSYTPPGATLTGLTTVTTNLGASSTASGSENSLITSPPTASPTSTSTSSTATKMGDAGRMKGPPGGVLAATLAVLMMLNTL